MKTFKVKEMIRLLETNGWFLSYWRGDHRQFKHPTRKGKITVSGRASDDLDANTAQSILKQAGLK